MIVLFRFFSFSVLFISLLFGSQSYAQEYKPLLGDWNEWQLTTCYYGCITDGYHTNGDTIVNGKTYKVLDGFHYISRSFLLREEVENQKVFLKLDIPGYPEEYLLYDFSLQVGDSIDIKNPISPFEFDAGYYQVDSIVRRPLADGNRYRHYYLSPTPSNTISTTPAEWVEGVGSLSMINAPGGEPDLFGGGRLSCFFKNGQLFYSDIEATGLESCEPEILNIPNNKVTDKALVINNTPHSVLLITSSIPSKIEVFDLSGRKLESKSDLNTKRTPIDFSGKAAGIYLIVVHTINSEKQVFRVALNP